MLPTPAIVRFRGLITPEPQSKDPALPCRVAVIEFPPQWRTLLVEMVVEKPFSHSLASFRCQIPYLIFVLFYQRLGGTIRLVSRPWIDPPGPPGYRRVCHFFREAPLASLNDPVYRSPLMNQTGPGRICFGYDPISVARLLGEHPSLHALAQTVVEYFWGSYHNGPRIVPVPGRGEYPDLYTIPDWAARSRRPGFLAELDWAGKDPYSIPNICPHCRWAGRFNPGYRRGVAP